MTRLTFIAAASATASLLAGMVGCSSGKATTGDSGMDLRQDTAAPPDLVAEAPVDVTPQVATAALNGLRWELPCSNNFNGYCDTPATRIKTATVMGNPGTVYDIQLRFRGVVEEKTYVDGAAVGHWQTGGVASVDLYNVYMLEIDQPPQTYYVNAGTSSLGYCVPVDFMASVKAATGATVTLSADSIDGAQVENSSEMGMPIVVPDITPAPAAYDGQFVQMDVVAVTLAP
jgi:hypothetical protein